MTKYGIIIKRFQKSDCKLLTTASVILIVLESADDVTDKLVVSRSRFPGARYCAEVKMTRMEITKSNIENLGSTLGFFWLENFNLILHIRYLRFRKNQVFHPTLNKN